MPRTYCRRSWLFHCPTNFSGQLFFCGRYFPSPRNAYHLAAAAETRDLNWAAIPDRLATTYAELAENNVTVVTSNDDVYRDALQTAGDAALKDWLDSTGERGQALIDAFNAAKAQ